MRSRKFWRWWVGEMMIDHISAKSACAAKKEKSYIPQLLLILSMTVVRQNVLPL